MRERGGKSGVYWWQLGVDVLLSGYGLQEVIHIHIVEELIVGSFVGLDLHHDHGHAVHVSLQGASSDVVWVRDPCSQDLRGGVEESCLDAVLNALLCIGLPPQDWVEL